MITRGSTRLVNGINQHRYMWSSTTTSGCRTRCTTCLSASCLRSCAARRWRTTCAPSRRLAHHDGVISRLDGVGGPTPSPRRSISNCVCPTASRAHAIAATSTQLRRRDAFNNTGPPPQIKKGALEVREAPEHLRDEARPAQNVAGRASQGH